jgi:hypothetical protein
MAYPSLYSKNLGLSLFGIDEVMIENMELIDAAYGYGGSINVNGTLITAPNLSSTTPVAPIGKELVTFQVDVNGNISAYVPIPSGGVTSFNTRTGAVVAVSTDYAAYYDLLGTAVAMAVALG